MEQEIANHILQAIRHHAPSAPGIWVLMKNIPSDIKALALEKELLNATRLNKTELNQLQALDGGNDFYHLPTQTQTNKNKHHKKKKHKKQTTNTTNEYSG